MRETPLKKAKLTAFGMTRRKRVAAKDDPGMIAPCTVRAPPCCTIVGKTWDFHVDEVLRVSRDENLAMIRESVAYLVSQGMEVIYDVEHSFDGFKGNEEYRAEDLDRGGEGGGSARWSSVTPMAGRCRRRLRALRSGARRRLNRWGRRLAFIVITIANWRWRLAGGRRGGRCRYRARSMAWANAAAMSI